MFGKKPKVFSKQWSIHVSPLEQIWSIYTSRLVTEDPMRWVSLLFSFVCLSVFRFMYHYQKWGGAYVDNQNCPFCEVIKIWNILHHCVPLVEVVKKRIWNI